jgi:LacI family transcriptional regulator
MAAEYLLGLGHKNIGLIHGASEVQTAHDFQDGVEDALGRAKCPLAPRRVEDGLFTEEGGASAAVELLSRDSSITALIAGNDKMAIGALAGLKNSGMRVPQHVSVVGCDDMHQAAFCDPPLTTVHTPIYDIGELACRRLMDIIDGRETAVEDRRPVGLTVRASSAPPRN